MKKILFFLAGMLLMSQLQAQFSIKGTVKDGDGQVLPGANVRLHNTLYGTSAQADGSFEISRIPKGEYELRCSMVGYELLKKNIQVSNADIVVDLVLQTSVNQLEEITVESNRVSDEKGIAYTDLDRSQVQVNNLGPDIPYLLDQTPSVVVTSDAGTGIGYTGIRIRGSDPTRINLTINGIPLNDAESQGTFLVNLPDFASSVNAIQIQRGVGTSTNGAGAFGASINLQTNRLNDKAYAEVSNSFGSFNTRRHNISAGTGLINDHFTFDLRLSTIKSDGYIERATSDLKSFYTSAAWFGKKTSLRFNIISGKEKTYQAWAGVPYDSLQTNRRFNPYTYENETDNYWQTHYQFFLNHQFSKKLTAGLTLHYTRGYGYYEQYKEDKAFSEIGKPDTIIGNDTIYGSDMIQQLWLDNHFYGAIFNVRYQANSKLDFVLGGGMNSYIGDHYGKIIWAEIAGTIPTGYRWYDNRGEKTDANIYLKADYAVNSKVLLYADLQYRSVEYSFLGLDQFGADLKQAVNLTFFNPKAGAVVRFDRNHSAYVSFGVGNKEPNRDDYVNNPPASQPVHESLYDYELGYRYRSGNLDGGLNFYYMNYKNQLALNGQINDVGNYVRSNIDESYRTGVEFDLAIQFTKRLSWKVNTTVSQNKVVKYSEYIDNWDTWGQDTIVYENTNLAFSPRLIGGSELSFTLWEKQSDSDKKKVSGRIDLSLISKYVGEQYLDNTVGTNNDRDTLTKTDIKYRKLDPYFVNDVRLTCHLKVSGFSEIDISFMVRNIIDEMYSSNGWVYKYSTGGIYSQMSGFYPQAGRNYLIGVTFRF